MTFSLQPSIQVPHNIHSVFSILFCITKSSTGRLIGHLAAHVWQCLHFSGSALRCNEGQPTLFLTFLPIIINGAIQHMWWQNDLFPKTNEGRTIKGCWNQSQFQWIAYALQCLIHIFQRVFLKLLAFWPDFVFLAFKNSYLSGTLYSSGNSKALKQSA